MKVAAPGLMVMAIIYFMGAVGGAHLNPAITLAFAVRRNFPWNRVPGYIIAQLLGGIAAAGFLWAMFGAVGLLGATTPGPGISDFKALIMEVLLTLGLVSTILGTASGARNIGTQRRSRGGRLYCPCGALGSTDQRGFYESRAVIRPRSGPRRNEHNLDLCRGPYNRRHDRRWV